MEVKAKVKHNRISPRKARLVVDVVRGMRIDQALNQLRFLHKKASIPVK
ncbi:MAG TPA: uL22 family ribosomal protein, partial [Patescibacteria group bacterium]|nr:uL22 family ribosomal protein [Patescibacteria group bacterium]